MNKIMGVFGGTFDPIHYGHLRGALELMQIMGLDQVRFVPSKLPVHKSSPPAATEHRLRMLELALSQQPGFIVDARELTRDSPSYMIETLRSLRQEFPAQALALILGADSFLQLNSWHQWLELPKYAHILVMTRPGHRLDFSTELLQFYEKHKAQDSAELSTELAGKVYIQAITSLGISATAIRAQLQAGLCPRFLLPDRVLEYIYAHKLYPPILNL